MSWLITEEVIKQVNRPIAAIAGGELYFDRLPDNGITDFINECTGTGDGTAYRIPTTSGIIVWASHQDGPTPDATIIRMGLAIGMPATESTLQLNGPIILAGEDTTGDTIPLSNHQIGHLVTLAVAIRTMIVVTKRDN